MERKEDPRKYYTSFLTRDMLIGEELLRRMRRERDTFYLSEPNINIKALSETSTPASTSTSATTLGNETLNLADEVKKYNTAQDYQTHEIQDINKHFKHCVENILFRMKNYGSLVVYKLESIRNEYVSTIFHTSLYIAETS
ncbi:hypothetical protein GLOIN_2v1709588 [Rhizophagus irregularis DAOM 181602=DAOM 197198]|nr:hypothetical protein GLOIN_2v1709588 [Rhizophagus irregularis DAOM 181602=DAOM 197198]